MDLASNFYTKEEHAGKVSRTTASIEKLKELNPHVTVDAHTGNLEESLVKDYDIFVITDYYDLPKLINLNKAARAAGKGFIMTGNLGLYGYLFTDFGDSFKISDKDGEENRSAIVVSITNEENGVVTVHEDKRHGFIEGDHVTFREVQGMDEVNGKTFPIKVLSPFSFQIGSTANFKAYEREGIVEQVKVPFEIKFNELSKSLETPAGPSNPEPYIADFTKMENPGQFHVALIAVYEFYSKNKRLPGLNNTSDAHTLIALAKEANEKLKKVEGAASVEEISDDLVTKVANFSQAQISPVASFWGGIVAQEIVKFTGKFTPTQQWFHYDFYESLPVGEVSKNLSNNRYDPIVAIYGNEVFNKLSSMKTFLIGAGALGCEYLKLFALTGISCANQGKLTCTDDDNIEVSNLNRQFLFRMENVKQSKSEAACKAVQKMNPAFNCQSLKLRVCPETEETFNDDFWEGLDCVVNAVDNVKARLFVDGRCVSYCKPLFESGTLGTKCNSQIVLPHKTQSYGDSQDPPEESIPLCTLKNFPHQIEHTIEWARDCFEGAFAGDSNELAQYLLNSSGYVDSLKKKFSGKNSIIRHKLETVLRLSKSFANPTIESCIIMARNMFQELFHNEIAQLLAAFPLDHKTEQGLPFWSGPKRPPLILNFDPKDPLHLLFVMSGSNLFAFMLGVPLNNDPALVEKVCNNTVIEEFKPKTSVKVTENNDIELNDDEEDEQSIAKCIEELSALKINTDRKVNIIEFEKDDDTNFHIDFMSATANLRARNYKIPEVDGFRVKLIAGKIIPAIATTTAMVVGAVGIEILKLAQDFEMEKFKNSFMNLALPFWLFSEPLPKIVQKDKEMDIIMMGPVKAIPPEFSNWDKIIVKGPMKLKDFLNWVKENYKVDVSIVGSGQFCIYNKYSNSAEMTGR